MMKTGNWKPFSIIFLVLLLPLTPAAETGCTGEIENMVATTFTTFKVPTRFESQTAHEYLTVRVSFRNTAGTEKCEFRVFLLNSDNVEKGKKPKLYWGDFDPGETGSYKVTARRAQFEGNTYMVKLKDYAAGPVDQREGTIPSEPAFDKFSVPSATCTCDDQPLEASGSSFSRAEYQCGSLCGGLTKCGMAEPDCVLCCPDYCKGSKGIGPPTGYYLTGCTDSCELSCRSNKFVNDLTNLFVAITLVIAVVMFAACGLKFITSDEPESRKQAKRCLIYVVVALILIGIAGAIVGVFYGPLT